MKEVVRILSDRLEFLPGRRLLQAGALLMVLGWSGWNSAADQSVLVLPSQLDEERLLAWKGEGFTGVVLLLSDPGRAAVRTAYERGRAAGWAVDYWIEVGRNEELADRHPEWMASIQTHPEWRRRFPDFPPLGSNEVAKVYPWVPVLYQETVLIHQARVRDLLAGLPRPRRLFLHDLQGAPSACGCGHHLCRWTTDYGPIKTATRLPNEAAADFVRSVQAFVPETEVVPVWATECEEHDRDGLCGGVGCYEGACWREWTAQLTPLQEAVSSVAVLATYRDLRRDLAVYGESAAWVGWAVRSFTKMPARFDREGVPANRLRVVLQGWDVTAEQKRDQIRQAQLAGVQGMVMALTPIEQGWKPVRYDRKHSGGQPSQANQAKVDAHTFPRARPTPELENLVQLSELVFSGGEPAPPGAMEHLRQLGMTTVVSVDGAAPPVAAARQHGLRYVHIPIGYDGISASQALALARVAREMTGPIYVHCHHGLHRGPAAAAIICQAAGWVDTAGALSMLRFAGTSTNYPGLWRDVANFVSPAPETPLPELMEMAPVESTAAAMAKADRALDAIKLCQQAAWKPLPDHPDLRAEHQALLLREALHEAWRRHAGDEDVKYVTWMREASDFSQDLAELLRLNRYGDVELALPQLQDRCAQCHHAYRN